MKQSMLCTAMLVGMALCNGCASVPPGAAALGYRKCAISETPTPADIGHGDNGDHKWFSGQWYARRVSSDYRMEDGALALSLGGDLVSTPRDFSKGRLPTLPGANGFYVEYDVQLSDNDPDHFPAVWLMPVEHNQPKGDHYAGDPEGVERWLELDVMEKMAYKGPGLIGTAHSWTGKYPHYEDRWNTNNISPVAIDFAKRHTFGASYDPKGQQVTWWVDGIRRMSIGAPYVPEVAVQQHFYLILSAQTHGKKVPYTMHVRGVRAFVPQESPLPAAD